MGEFSAGSVIGRSFSIWIKNFIPFTLMSLLVFAPLLLWGFSIDTDHLDPDDFEKTSRVMQWLSNLLGYVATGAISYGVFQQLRGQHASIGKCIGVGLGRLFPVLGVAILTGISVGLGTVLLIVPGMIIACMLWVAVPVAVVERPGVFASLSRSAELTKGHKWSIFGIFVLLLVINLVMGFVLGAALLGASMTADSMRTFFIGLIAMLALIAPLQAVASAVAYHDLRVSKEGVNADELGRVFD